jgi:hypothetical protein
MEENRLGVEALIVEAMITVEAIGAGIEVMVAKGGITVGLIEAGRAQERAKTALGELADLIRPAALEADAHG